MIGEALRLLRVFNDLKQDELARELGLSRSYISEIESGRKRPNFDVIESYSKFFGIRPSLLMFFSEELDLELKASNKSKYARAALDILRKIEKKFYNGEGEEEVSA